MASIEMQSVRLSCLSGRALSRARPSRNDWFDCGLTIRSREGSTRPYGNQALRGARGRGSSHRPGPLTGLQPGCGLLRNPGLGLELQKSGSVNHEHSDHYCLASPRRRVGLARRPGSRARRERGPVVAQVSTPAPATKARQVRARRSFVPVDLKRMFTAGPLSDPQPPSTLLPAGAVTLDLTLRAATPTLCRYSVGKNVPFDQMTEFDTRQTSSSPRTVIRGLDPDPGRVNDVYIRSAAAPEAALHLQYRSLPASKPGFPPRRTCGGRGISSPGGWTMPRESTSGWGPTSMLIRFASCGGGIPIAWS